MSDKESKPAKIRVTSEMLEQEPGEYFEGASRREWLVTNGLGGYGAGTMIGANTRRYHGLLVAALRPPVERTVLVSKVDVIVQDGQRHHPLSTNEFADGTISPDDYLHPDSLTLDGLIPVWTYRWGEACLEQRVWMAHGQNTTYLTYTLTQANEPITLKLTPFCTYRDYHSHSQGGWDIALEPVAGGFEVRAFEAAQPYRLLVDRGEVSLEPDWYWNFKHRLESYRGLDDTEDLFVPGHFTATLPPGETLTLICTTEPLEPQAGAAALAHEQARQQGLLANSPADEPAWISHLALAADQFIVQRSSEPSENGPAETAGATVIAGYPWFSDWGRDTMIALPGLTLATGRDEVAATILRTFARHISQGMLPNRFPDAGQAPEYNTVDATLWYFHAVHQYLQQTDDLSLARELYPKLVDILDWHRHGTRYNIHTDPDDGLLFAGELGVQLTWMDAKVGDWVVTPRRGKPVEVNALWHNALRVMAWLAERLEKPDAAKAYRQQAEQVANSFRERFWNVADGYLYDVIDGPEGDDASLRPNQLFAVSLPFSLLDEVQAKAVVDSCARALWTPYGLRSLAPDDKAYVGHYGGDQTERDGAYHQGTVWGWLLGPFVTAHYRVYGDASKTRAFLAEVEPHLLDGCLGSISEIFDGDPPHTPRGCFAQAWSVAELLRAWRTIGKES